MSLFLCLRGNTYHFRRVVPLQLRPYLGKREFRKSLRTGNKLEGQRKVLLINNKFQQFIDKACRIVTKKTLSEVEKQDLIKLVFHRFQEINDEFLDDKYLDFPVEPQFTYLRESSLEDDRKHFEKKLHNSLIWHHEKRDYDFVKPGLNQELGPDKVKNLPLNGRILHELSLASLDAGKIILERRQGKNPTIPNQYRDTKVTVPPVPHITASPESTPSVTTPPSVVPLTQVISEYTKDRESIKKWSDKSKRENLACYENFLNFTGTKICCSEINYHLVSDYRAALLKLPANRKKVKKYRKKPLPNSSK